jgi:hypothetical protein
VIDNTLQLTRLGYFFKNPKLYGEATLAVLRETAKRYDDALDDCLIQIVREAGFPCKSYAEFQIGS